MRLPGEVVGQPPRPRQVEARGQAARVQFLPQEVRVREQSPEPRETRLIFFFWHLADFPKGDCEAATATNVVQTALSGLESFYWQNNSDHFNRGLRRWDLNMEDLNQLKVLSLMAVSTICFY